MTHDAAPADAAQVIATLLVTPDEQLPALRKELFGDEDVPVDRLKAARELLRGAASLLRHEEGKVRMEKGLAAMKPSDAEPMTEAAADVLLAQVKKGDSVPPMAPKVGMAPTRTGPTSGEVSPLAGAELPFDSPKHESEHPPPVAPKVMDDTSAGATAGVGEVSPLTDASFAKAPRPVAPVELTVEQYASLCASFQVHPDRYADTLSQYHLPDEDAHRALDVHWGSRFQRDPGLKQKYDGLFLRHVDWLRDGGDDTSST